MRSPYGGLLTTNPVGASLVTRQLLEIASFDMDNATQLRALDVLDRRTHGRRVGIVATQCDFLRRRTPRGARELPESAVPTRRGRVRASE